jgi:CRISPR system Cascade subunit CasE
MMYLSLVEIKADINNAKYISNPYKLHQAIWEAFKEGSRDFLFRIENNKTYNGNWRIYILSQRKPDFKGMEENTKLEIANTGIKEFAPSVTEGMRLKFYLRANPTVKTKNKNNPDKQTRYNIIDEKELDEWIKRKGKAFGFEPKSYNLRNKYKYRSYKGADSPPITHGGIDFEGILEVKDKASFIDGLKNGIGSAKAFGFGLLTVMPA